MSARCKAALAGRPSVECPLSFFHRSKRILNSRAWPDTGNGGEPTGGETACRGIPLLPLAIPNGSTICFFELACDKDSKSTEDEVVQLKLVGTRDDLCSSR